MLTFLIGAITQTHTLNLVDNGIPKVEIDLPIGAGPIENRAAEILQSSVKKMSGAVLPIAQRDSPQGQFVAIGYPAAAFRRFRYHGLKRDGFVLATMPNGLLVESGGREGSIYGVVQLLEQFFGCRCYSPSAWVFPHRSSLSLPDVSEGQNPAFDFRVVNGEFSNDEDYLDWQRLNRVDEEFGNGYYVHTSKKLVPPDQYFKDHPEYFALINGKRSINQICPSAPENVDIVVDNLKKQMALQPDRQVWSVSQNDNDTYCQCPLCAKTDEEEGSPSGAYIRFVNQVAGHFPDKTIATLAYQFSRPAPKVTRPDPNVLMMLCSIELNRSKAIADDPTSQDFVKDLSDWSKLTNDLYIWDYTVDFAHQVSPFPNLYVLQPNLQLFAKDGVKQMFEQTNTSKGHEFSELKSYLLAKLMWNPEADVDAIEKEFLNGYYDAAGPFLYQYIKRQESELQRSGQRLDIYGPPNNYEDGFLSAENIEAYKHLFDQAEAAVRGDSELVQRVKVARLPLQYAMLQIGWADVFGPRGFYDRNGSSLTLKPLMGQTLNDFYATCVRNGVKTLNESGLTPKAYFDAASRMMEMKIEGNLAFSKPVTASPLPSTKYSKGDLRVLTDGVLGGSDYTAQWIGWEGKDFDLTVDLGAQTNGHSASIDSLSNQRSWVLHPVSVSCSVSSDGQNFTDAGTDVTGGDQQHEPIIHTYQFHWTQSSVRYVRFHVTGTKTLPAWHDSPGGKSWVFVDGVVVRS